MTHTEEPWKFIGKGVMHDLGSSILHPCTNGKIVGARNEKIISAYSFGGVHGDSPEQAEANANRIVACVNALAGLRPEAVREMREALEQVERDIESTGYIQVATALQVSAALKAVEESTPEIEFCHDCQELVEGHCPTCGEEA